MAKQAKEEKKKDPILDDEAKEKDEAEEVESTDEVEETESAEEDSEESESKVEEKKAEKPAPEKKVAGKPATSPAVGFDRAAHTKAILDKQPKVAIIVPLADNEEFGATESVNINGHKYTIRKGDQVLVPQAVANIIADKYKINMMAGADKLANRKKDVASALDA